MPSTRVNFAGAFGDTLAARLDRPDTPARAYALFAHCFTCGKDIAAASRIARTLAAHGIAVLRFDFTGLGSSDGDFANTHFSSNVDDLVAAADHLREHFAAPSLIIGHSLGGAAVIAAAHRIPEAKAVVTIGAPSDPGHVTHLFDGHRETIEQEGEAEVSLAGRPFTIRKGFLDDVCNQSLTGHLRGLKKALLVLHGPLDATVGIDNAQEIFIAARHPKSYVTLDRADHLLRDPADAAYAADVIAAWVQRYLPAEPAEMDPLPDGVVEVRERGVGKFQQVVRIGDRAFIADEPKSFGGDDLGPTPYDLLLAGLGACTAMTVRMYARHKKWPMQSIAVRLTHRKIHATDCATCETATGKIDHIHREIVIDAPQLDAAQRDRLIEIANRCPVHRTLHSEVLETTERVDAFSAEGIADGGH